MRTFFRDHWKAIAIIVVLILLAMFTVSPGEGAPAPASAPSSAPDSAARLRAHVAALAPGARDSAGRPALEPAARHIEAALRADGYAVVHRDAAAGGRRLQSIEASIARVAPHAGPARIFIVGARYGAPGATPPNPANPADTASSSSPAAGLLELAHLLKGMRPSQGTEVKFVFFADPAAPRPEGKDARAAPAGFIVFAGTRAASRRVQQALSAFQAAPDVPARGLAAPAYVQGLSLSGQRFGYPAITITASAFGRYPCSAASGGAAGDSPAEPAEPDERDEPDEPDYADLARAASGLALTIEDLAGTQQD